MTAPLQRVLRAFLEDPAAPRYGYDLMKAAGLPSGTLYPMLARLEDQKLVTSAWETPQAGGDRPRRYYQLTGEGIRVAWLCRRRGARRGGVGKNGVLKSAHWLGVRAALLVGLAILLAAQAFLVYQIIFGKPGDLRGVRAGLPGHPRGLPLPAAPGRVDLQRVRLVRRGRGGGGNRAARQCPRRSPRHRPPGPAVGHAGAI